MIVKKGSPNNFAGYPSFKHRSFIDVSKISPTGINNQYTFSIVNFDSSLITSIKMYKVLIHFFTILLKFKTFNKYAFLA